ncbi:hypothetical protein HNP49_003169 [Pseudomonas fluvialis]|uniref:DUF4019 domain-containing protein n=1 Tax=Pseudomonas fluvialis TaxID=1793966 RepID=A0A7X0EVV6_9PSED|nr:hypothetical protein [Pseudomonas fluvialis]MBB6342981.1 hypothetical protein [Pseudomonas fluvialis]
MRLHKAIIAAFFSIAAMNTYSAEPLYSIDEFEKKFTECLTAAAKKRSTCVENLIIKHLPVDIKESKPQAASISRILDERMGDGTLYKLHKIKSIDGGDLFFKRVSIIEDSAQTFMAVDCTYVNFQGDLYLYSIRLNSNKEGIEEALGFEI